MSTVSGTPATDRADVAAQLHHVGLVVQDAEPVVTFLEQAFGLQVVETIIDEAAGMRAVMLSVGSVQVEIVERGDAEARRVALDGAPARLDHLAFEVSDLDDVLATLRALGAESETESPIDLGDRSTIFLRAASALGVRFQLLSGTE
ncbi:VOC family protein [Patulibacter sp. NPDC049589]|uniref:VOC family protein n=1 Tax=Patulibacter sp. NPDC049589 TaxID=3154731 RepID=UPI00343C2F28